MKVFSHSRPYSKSGNTSGERDLADVWIDRTYITCEESFPTVLRRSEVKSVQSIEVSAIQNALDDIQAKTKELDVGELRRFLRG